MPGSRILLGCLLLVAMGCAHGAGVQTPQVDPLIGTLTLEQALAQMKRRPDYRCEGDEGIVVAWIDHYPPETVFRPPSSSPVYYDVPHGRHTHFVFNRETKLLTWRAIKQW